MKKYIVEKCRKREIKVENFSINSIQFNFIRNDGITF